jgi:hypothetical protein
MAKPHDQGPTVKGQTHRAWPHGVHTYDQGPKIRGLRPILAQKWVFKLYYMILLIFHPILGDFGHYSRIWSSF